MTEFGSRLKLLGEFYDVTQLVLAEKLNLNKSTISRYESCEIEPTLESANEIAKYFNVSLDWLAGNGAVELYIKSK